MTVIVAALLPDKAVIGSDSSCNTGDMCIKSATSKLISFGNFIVGFAGGYAGAFILMKLSKLKTFKSFRIKSELDCIKLQSRFFKELRSVYEPALSFDKSKDGTDLVPELLVLTKDKIFYVDELSVVAYGGIMAIGSGNQLALGAAHALFPNKDCVKKAILTACEYSDSCSETVVIKEIPRK